MNGLPKRRGPLARTAGLAALIALCAAAAFAGSGNAANPPHRHCSNPTLTGTPQAGRPLTAHPGDCDWAGPYTYYFAWFRCDKNGHSCARIANASSPTYVATSTDVSHTIKVNVGARNTKGFDIATSDPTALVVGRTANAPKNTGAPAISGTAQQGQNLQATGGSWAGASPIAFTFQWERCDTSGNNCANIIGAQNQSYTLSSADVGNTLRVAVTAKNSDGSGTATSAQTDVVQGPTKPKPSGTLQVGDVNLPDRLVISQVVYEPNVLRDRSPFVMRVRVTDSDNGLPVEGAQVHTIGIPYRRIADAGYPRTDGQGWASFTLQPTSLMPLVRGAVIVMYIGAKQPGTDIRSGTSATLLSQVRISPS